MTFKVSNWVGRERHALYVRVNNETRDKISKIAKKNNITVTELSRQMIMYALDNIENKEKE